MHLCYPLLAIQTVSLPSFPSTPSGILSFKVGYARGVAMALNVSSSDVKVTEVTVLPALQETRRYLLSVSVKVSYIVAVPAGVSFSTLQGHLTTVQLNGGLDKALISSGISGAATSLPEVVDISPTSNPTVAPTVAAPAVKVLNIKAVVGGVIGGFFGLFIVMCAIGTVCYYRYKKRPRVYINAQSNPGAQPPQIV